MFFFVLNWTQNINANWKVTSIALPVASPEFTKRGDPKDNYLILFFLFFAIPTLLSYFFPFCFHVRGFVSSLNVLPTFFCLFWFSIFVQFIKVFWWKSLSICIYTSFCLICNILRVNYFVQIGFRNGCHIQDWYDLIASVQHPILSIMSFYLFCVCLCISTNSLCLWIVFWSSVQKLTFYAVVYIQGSVK